MIDPRRRFRKLMTDVSDQPYERIDASRRYVLGEVSEGEWEGFGIWDRLAGNRLVERFPPTEEGSTAHFNASAN